jgi:NADH dehydrogenase
MVGQNLQASPHDEQHEEHVEEVLELQPPGEAGVDRRRGLRDAGMLSDEGLYAGKLVHGRLACKTLEPFHYWDKGSLATIGRAAAVADFGRIHIDGYFAWLTWLFVHLMYLVEFDNRLLVLIQWAYNYFTRNRGARLITRDGP